MSWPENFLRDTTGFVQKMFYKPAGYVAGLFEDIGNLKDLAEENKQLKILAAQYARDKAQYNFIQARNDSLEKNGNLLKNRRNCINMIIILLR